eukprot:TRINITY_DN12844_c0_g2_i1.p1 TRINITY_DN12844_c0_g2~~TRINITY_DN12844_c0_g2_i1.p1  ORF type:complete len:307 (+),score=104.31 TRINITY_DN12844_c0_g2_i1:77-997(+)
MPFAQVVVGPPGSGKSTYCNGMHQLMTGLNRRVVIVNLDPANEHLSYPCEINVDELVCLESVMERYKLGPNGGLIFCMEYIEKNIGWLLDKMKAFEDAYFIFDCPGQVELYTNHESLQHMLARLQKEDFRIACVHLVDATLCASPANFISAAMLSLSAMVRLELPHINVLSKVDLLRNIKDELAFSLDFYTDLPYPERLAQLVESEDPFLQRFGKLNHAVCELIDDFRLVSFQLLAIEDKEMTYNLLKTIDKANGFVFGGLTEGNDSIMAVADSAGFEYFRVADIQDRYMNEDDWEAGEEDPDPPG